MTTRSLVQEPSQPGRSLSNCQLMTGYAEKLSLTISEGYPCRNAESAGLLREQLVKTPRSSRWYDMHTDKKDSGRSNVCSWSQEPAKLNSAFSRVARHSLPSAPPSWAITQDILRHSGDQPDSRLHVQPSSWVIKMPY